MIPGKVIGPEDIVRALRRRLWVIAIPAVTIGVVAAVVSTLLPDRFRSETLILVVPQRVPDTYVRSTVTAKIEDRLPSIQQQILSRTRLERIILDFSLYPDDRKTRPMEDVVATMRQHIDVRIVEGDAFRVGYETGDPRTAQKVTERLAALFIEENLRDRETLAADTRAFIESQLENARQRLVEHEQRLEAFRKEHSGELPSQAEAIIQAIQNRQLQLQALTDSAARDRDRRIVAERMRADLMESAFVVAPAGSAAGTGDVAVTAPAAVRLEAALGALAEMESRLTPEHPDVRRMKRTIASLEKEAAAEAVDTSQRKAATEVRTLTPAELSRRNRLQELEAEILNLERQIQYKEDEELRLRTEIREYQTRAEAIPTRESQLVALTRDYDTIRETYQSLLKKREDSKLAEDLERRQIGEQFKILDPANRPERPYRPNRPLINLLGVLAGLGLGVGIAGLLEFRDQSLRFEADVKAALDLPVLAVIPVLPAVGTRSAPSRVLWFSGLAVALLVVGVAAYALLGAG